MAGGPAPAPHLCFPNACPLDPDALAAFVQHNCAAHFVEVGELHAALDVLSLADVLETAGARRGAGSWTLARDDRLFPGEYVLSLAARAVAAARTVRSTNQGFLPVLKPAVYELRRSVAEAQARHLGEFRSHRSLRSGATIALEFLPWSRLIGSPVQALAAEGRPAPAADHPPRDEETARALAIDDIDEDF